MISGLQKWEAVSLTSSSSSGTVGEPLEHGDVEQRPRIQIPKDVAIHETRVYIGAVESKGFLFSVTPREWLWRGFKSIR